MAEVCPTRSALEGTLKVNAQPSHGCCPPLSNTAGGANSLPPPRCLWGRVLVCHGLWVLGTSLLDGAEPPSQKGIPSGLGPPCVSLTEHVSSFSQ